MTLGEMIVAQNAPHEQPCDCSTRQGPGRECQSLRDDMAKDIDAALAQAQSRVTQLEAAVNTRDLAIERWCDELAQAQGEIERLKNPKCACGRDLKWICSRCDSGKPTKFDELSEERDALRAQVERLTAALKRAEQLLVEASYLIQHETDAASIGWREKSRVVRADFRALTEPGGQP